jgi:branched-chain amino acid transport system permease protein
MSVALQSYLITLLVYLGVNAIACWALNLQFGLGGVMNFAFILFQSIGAYVTAVLTLPKSDPSTFETYILGWHLPWPLPLAGAAIAGGVLALIIGSFALRPARRDFQATVMLVVSIIASTLVVTQQGWFNGASGLYSIPQPFASGLNLSPNGYGWFFVGITVGLCVVVYFFVDRVTSSPWGRRLRAMRENPEAVESLGTKVSGESLKLYVVGGAIAALSGGLLVEFIGAWSPSAWSTGETFIYFVAIIVGGLGNNFGALFGAFLVMGVFLEVPQYLPSLSYTNSEAAIQSALIGVLILVFLWFRPKGAIPERRRKLGVLARVSAQEGAHADPQPSTPITVTDERAPARAAATAIVVRDLECSFGGVKAVDGISFDVRAGQATGLIGPNGAGKSTALKLMAGALSPTGGSIVVDGVDMTGWSAARVARAGVIRTFQHTSEFGRLTVLENLLVAAPGQPGDSFGGAMLGRRHARPRQRELLAQAWTLLEQFNLTQHADTYAGELSGGQRRLVEIMRALMARPKILLLDEPMAGVNPMLRVTIEEHLQRLRDGGLTMLMVEHELGAIERVCDSVVVMAQGKLLATGSMSELRQNEEVVNAYLVG